MERPLPNSDGAPAPEAGTPERPTVLPQFAEIYTELRVLAAKQLAKELPGQTLQPTALVHEAWLRMGGEAQPRWSNRAHFWAAAAESMRRILIDAARHKNTARKGGGVSRVSVDETGFDIMTPTADCDELLLIHEALDLLAADYPRQAELVKQVYFVGLSLKDAGEVLDLSESTAKRDWNFARAYLYAAVTRLRG